jgi:hypothetical protein
VRHRARLKVSSAPSSLTGFFLYAPPDYESEIDIEILNDASGTAWFPAWLAGTPSPGTATLVDQVVAG